MAVRGMLEMTDWVDETYQNDYDFWIAIDAVLGIQVIVVGQ